VSNKLTVLAVAMLLTVILIGTITAIAGNRKDRNESSAESALSAENSGPIIVPSSMPEGISVTVPGGFAETSSPRYDKYYIRDDASIIITGEELVISGQILGEYAEDMKKQYEAAADNFRLISEEDLMVNGVECRMMEFTYSIVGENVQQDFVAVTGVLLQNNHVYIITCKSRKETFAAYRESFRQTVKSAVISAPAAGTAQTTALTGVSETVQSVTAT